MNSCLYRGIKQLVTLSPLAQRGYPAHVTEADLGILNDAWVLVENGKVAAVGAGTPPDATTTINLGDALVLPGLVDAHTHPIFAGNRANEFAMRINGETYQSIAAQGGGIKATVKPTRAAPPEELQRRAKQNLQTFLEHGVTSVECKTGYGLSVDEELRQLRLLKELQHDSVQHLSITCLALHAWPLQGEDRENYIRNFCNVLLPKIAEEKLATAVDAFIEAGYFTANDVAPYFKTAQKLGLAIRMHVDEFTNVSGGELAATYGALSADHCECTTPEGARAMAEAKVTAVILPGTSLYSKIPYANAPMFRKAGTAMAIATDFNPGSCTLDNLPMIASLSALYCGTNLAETIAGVTYVPAYSLRIHAYKGHLSQGADADFCVYESFSSVAEWLADFGKTKPKQVLIRGKQAI